ncbi:MAG: metal-dependent transcriptional regulator [Deltaproteobacteria bacterium]|nr:metal-dependent transcriptional regulator [Deltaproteobacteria bacterium]
MDRKHRENTLEAILMAEERAHGEMDDGADCADPAIGDQDIRTLVQEGLITSQGTKLALTAEGRAMAEDVTRRHRLTEVLFASLLGLDRERASELACIVEHDIRPELVDGVCTLLGHPATCPHGGPIPPGSCCKDGRTTVESQVVPLTALQPGERGRIIYIKPRDHQRLHRLTSLGVTPGLIVEMHRRHPAFCIHFDGTDLALDADVAADIHVSHMTANGADRDS